MGLAIGAYASNEEKPNAGGELYSKATYKYGRFVASMKASRAMGSASAFALYDLESFADDQDVFDNWNAMATVPSLTPALYSRMNHELKEEWEPYMDFTLDDDYHKFEIEWTPKNLVYKIDNKVVRTKEDFKLHFRDDFDTYDQNRWVSADNKTWDGMDSTFKKENAFVSDGRLFLRLDKNNDYPKDEDEQSGDDDEHSGDDSHDGEDFHVLPAPKDGTLDAAIEKATRVGVVMVRQYLDHFSSSMSHHLQ